MMEGLLDFAKSPAGMGLLSAGLAYAANANRNTPVNNIGRAGLAGLTGYTAAGALQEQQAKREQAEKVRRSIPTLYSQGPDGAMKFDTMTALQLGISPKDIMDYANVSNAGRAKVKRSEEIAGPDGSKQIVQLDEYGRQVGDGMAGYVAPQLVDTGDTKQFVTPSAGQSFQVGMSPAQQAGLALRGQQNDIMREQNQVMRELGLQEKALKVEDLQAKRDERQRGLDAQRASIDSQIGVIDKALNHPGRETATGMSGTLDPRNYTPGTNARDFQVVLDQLGGAAFLQAFQSLKGGGAITEVEGKKATDAMARLNRAQSDAEFEQSLRELRDVMEKGKARLAAGQVQQAAPQPAQRQIMRTGRDANGRRVVQYSDGSVEYGD